ncbi:unnamed protein product [Schistosoma turkestanicum]|nr:unnamed protein product [Schistosoma turkestanicum]
MCCLSKQISDRGIEKKDSKQLAADINGLILAFSRFKDVLLGDDNDLEKMKSFFETFAKVGYAQCNDFIHSSST